MAVPCRYRTRAGDEIEPGARSVGPMNSIFRREALAAHQGGWIGEVQLARPVGLAWWTATVMTAVVALGAFLCWGEYTRKVHVTGVLVPDAGVARIHAPEEALLLESRVVEGARVQAGDVLFVLSLERASAAGETQVAVQRSLNERQRSLREAERQQQLLLDAQRAALARRVADMQRDLSTVDAESTVLAQRIALAEENEARFEALRRENFVSPLQAQAKREEALSLRTQAQSLQRQRGALQRDIDTAQAQWRELPLQHAVRVGELGRDRAGLDQQGIESEARRRLVISAPHDGIVSALSARAGQTVTPALALAMLVPARSRLEAHLYAPSSAVGFLHDQQSVLLRYEAFPYQKFGLQHGRVTSVSLTPLSPTELAGQPWAAAAREPMYRIAVALERQEIPIGAGAARNLVPGMQLEADVPIERRRLVEWLFAPVVGWTQRL